MKKRVFAIALALVLCISLLPVTAFAAAPCRNHYAGFGGNLVAVSDTPADCENDGIDVPDFGAYFRCRDCKNFFGWNGHVYFPVDSLVVPAGHTAGEAVIENETEFTCEVAGSYEEVVYCEACGEKLSSETVEKELAACVPGEAVIENVANGFCWHWVYCEYVTYCTECDEETGRNPGWTWGRVHVPGEAVQENVVASTCYAEGSYEEVVRCVNGYCNAEISRETKAIAKIAHTPAEAVVEKEVAPTCTEAGSYDSVVYCSVEECKHEISRETIAVEALGHTEGEAVRENEVASTCKVQGTYDEVVYCTVEDCGAEISRTEKKLELAEEHTNVLVDEAVAPTCEDAGLTEGKHCEECGEVILAQEVVAALGHDWEDEGKITKEPTKKADGEMTYTCKTDKTHTKTEVVKYVPSAYDDVPKTGDNTVVILATMTIVAMISAAAYVFSKRRSAC